jgi:hypothetical protein
MFHPTLVTHRTNILVDQVRALNKGFKLRDWTSDDALSIALEIPHWDGKDQPPKLTPFQQDFIVQQLIRCRADAKYWLNTYAAVKTKAQALQRLILLESQEVAFDRIAATELACHEGRRYDGLLFVCLKARQLGMSTLIEALVLLKTIFTPYTTSLVASDEEPNSAHLFDMAERVYDNLPWWMRPMKTFHVKNREMVWGQIDSEMICRWGKSMGGGKSTGDELGRGQIGRGWTIPIFHISELATWENPSQLDESFFATVPVLPSSFGFLESTGRGRHNWWHQRWEASVKGSGRFEPIFIPWFAETQTYRRPAPVGWQPQTLSLQHAMQAEKISQKWCGRTIRLDRDQLFWWETERADYELRGKLAKFLAEYCADPEDSFQNLEGCVFGSELVYRMGLRTKEVAGAFELG